MLVKRLKSKPYALAPSSHRLNIIRMVFVFTTRVLDVIAICHLELGYESLVLADVHSAGCTGVTIILLVEDIARFRSCCDDHATALAVGAST